MNAELRAHLQGLIEAQAHNARLINSWAFGQPQHEEALREYTSISAEISQILLDVLTDQYLAD